MVPRNRIQVDCFVPFFLASCMLMVNLYLTRFDWQAKYSGEIVGVALDPLPSGPFFRDVGTAGFAKDSSSAATLMDKAK